MNYKQKVGKFGEKLAENFLIRRGYQIIETNVKISFKEIDIIAKIKGKYIFIEVKTHISKKFGSADWAINGRKLSFLKKAIDMYVHNRNLDPENVRLDFIAIDIDKFKETANIKHYKDIF